MNKLKENIKYIKEKSKNKIKSMGKLTISPVELYVLPYRYNVLN